MIGYVTYRTLVRTTEKAAITDLVAVLGAVGGGIVTSLFEPGSALFAWYAIGLLVGMAGYFAIYLAMNGRKGVAAVMGGGETPGPPRAGANAPRGYPARIRRCPAPAALDRVGPPRRGTGRPEPPQPPLPVAAVGPERDPAGLDGADETRLRRATDDVRVAALPTVRTRLRQPARQGLGGVVVQAPQVHAGGEGQLRRKVLPRGDQGQMQAQLDHRARV